MLLYKVVIETTGHFVTPIKGDTLFGHFCWSYRESFGESRLEHDILNGYTQSQPKIIFSDAYAHGYFYLPKYQILIEIDGQQHDTVIDMWGGVEGLKDRVKKDKIKNDHLKFIPKEIGSLKKLKVLD